MEFWADPSNSRSGIIDRSLESTSLFFFANTSSMKQWEEPESNKALNGWACSDTVADVRERRKEFRESEVEFSRITGAALSLFGQLLKSTMLEKLPLSFPISRILLPPQSPLLGHSPVLPQPGVLWPILALMWGIHLPSGYQSHRLGITCSCVDIQAPPVWVSHPILTCYHRVSEYVEWFRKPWVGEGWLWSCGW